MVSDPRVLLGHSTTQVGKVRFVRATLSEAVDSLISLAQDSVPASVRLANAYCVAVASRDPQYEEVLNSPGLTFPDGTPVVWMMRLRGDAKASVVRGPALFKATLAAGCTVREPLRHFFLGSTPEILDALTQKVRGDYPSLEIAGTFSPAFGPLSKHTLTESADAVRASGANILWVGMGSPKQDFAARSLAEELGIPCVAVGAAFNFVAKPDTEAPGWMHGTGIEWVYRLVKEPRRLWKRYLFGNAQFLYSAAIHSNRT